MQTNPAHKHLRGINFMEDRLSLFFLCVFFFSISVSTYPKFSESVIVSPDMSRLVRHR